MYKQDFHISFNARHLDPEQVAENFIISKSFENLIQNNHSVVLGARGCGKTTLMKMLTLSAMNTWKGGAKSVKIKNNLPFYSVYISTDIYWNVKNYSYAHQLEKFGSFSLKISRFSVTSHIFIALCNTFQEILHYDNFTDLDKETELCEILIEAWKLKKTIPKLQLVKEALNKRIDELNQFIQNVIFDCKTEEDIVYDNLDFLSLMYMSSLEYLIPIFERIYGLQKKKWALCFDELELAPEWLQGELFGLLRSTNQNILFKLSASPIISLPIDFNASPNNDLQLIKMWDYPEKELERFSRSIIEQIVKKKYGKKIDLVNLFGSSGLIVNESYDIGSKFHSEVHELVSKDKSFKNFLIKKNINLDHLTPIGGKDKDSVFRKIKPIVYYRNFYIKEVLPDEHGALIPKLRSRKTSELYTGIESLCKICDGNPRWLIGILNALFSGSESSEYINPNLQGDVLHETSKQFFNIISNIPITPYKGFTLEKVIRKIGETFSKQIIGGGFTMDPRGSFIVDESSNELPDEIIGFLEKAAYQGAIIMLDSDDTTFDFEIRGKRFRLTYLLAPLFKLPLRVYGHMQLSQCLSNENSSFSQTNLFQ